MILFGSTFEIEVFQKGSDKVFDLIGRFRCYTFENFGAYWNVPSGSFVFKKSQ